VNTYRVQFSRRCPVNNERIFYSLEISCERRIMAEHIETALAAIPDSTLHEDAADTLFTSLPGRQTIDALHGFVHITTERGQP
jgi:hypothetical protein